MIGDQPDGTFIVEKKRPQLHASTLEMKCMEQIRRRFIEGEIIPPGVAMVVGTGTHKSIEKNLTSKIVWDELLPVEEVADIARDEVNQAWESSEIRLEPEELEKGLKVVKGRRS